MLKYVAGRVVAALVLSLGVATVCFALLWFAPGDSSSEAVLSGDASALQMSREPEPLIPSYVEWLSELVRGDLGQSEVTGLPVARMLGSALPHTVALSVLGLGIALLLGVGIAVVQASRVGTWVDRTLSLVTVILYSAPAFWVGLLLAESFVDLPAHLGYGRWLPRSGVAPAGGASSPIDLLPHLVLPAMSLGLVLGAGLARFTRSALIDVLEQDYVRAARARGLSESRVLLRYGLRTALLPVISLLGIYLPLLLTGAVFVEEVFNRVGVGRVMLYAIGQQDVPVVVGGALLFGIAAVAGNLVADLLYGWADPRVGDAARG